MGITVGIDIGGTNIAIGIVEDHIKILGKDSIPTDATLPFKTTVSIIANKVENLLKTCGLTKDQLQHIGVGVPSNIEKVSRKIIYANNLNWINVDMIKELQQYFSVPIFVENDAACAALAEATNGAGKEFSNVFMLTIGTGIGGSLIFNKKIFPGGDGLGCEPGHMVIDMNGRPCTCGNKGCLETYASATALCRMAQEQLINHKDSILWDSIYENGNVMSGRLIFDCAKQGDLFAQSLIAEFVHYLAIGISNFIAFIRPEVVVVGGGMSSQKETLMIPLNQAVNEICYGSKEIGLPPIVAATLGNDAGIIGAAMLGCEK